MIFFFSASCAQRAFPRIGHDLVVPEDRGTFVPYPTEAG
jgi:hypothetical protein